MKKLPKVPSVEISKGANSGVANEASQCGSRSFFNDAMALRTVIALLRQKFLECFGGY
jgi:hypothetical protein